MSGAGQEEILAAMRTGYELRRRKSGQWILLDPANLFAWKRADGRAVVALVKRGTINHLADGTYQLSNSPSGETQ